MKCNQCDRDMMIINSKPTSEVGSTDIYNTQEFACTNAKCVSYAGTDLGNPKASIKGTPVKIN